MHLYKAKDEVNVCVNQDTCIQARGQNGQVLVAAFTFVLLCAGIALLAK